MCSNIAVCFVQSCLRKSTTNAWIWNRCKHDEHDRNNYMTNSQNEKSKTAQNWTKKWTKPYDKQLINLVSSVCTEKYLPSGFLFRPHSFVLRSVRKLQANTFLYFNILLSILLLFFASDFLSHYFFFLYIYKFTWFFIHSMFLSDDGPTLETLDFTLSVVH